MPRTPKICSNCKACGLHIFQAPVFDQLKLSTIFWVGLSAVKFDAHEEKLPLSPSTASGALVHSIEAPYLDKLSFYKTNLVKCAPMQGNKLRYPLKHEMAKCFPNFQWELETLQPKTVFLLGNQVASFVLQQFNHSKSVFSDGFNYSSFDMDGIRFIPIHHPSYMLVYRRKLLAEYMEGVRAHFPVKTSSAVGKKERTSLVLSSCRPSLENIKTPSALRSVGNCAG
ncbi:MAG: hypothetical protein H6577_06420 [Lewinellaceae bacterium]|nr:hypothetical protein [Saprospiraceae bacterium]MCB9337742.1 hypothetical protein [Lewinellaceae bacterium]